ncbi:ATP-dependent DNA ligase [Streptomyces hydrogenans]|uniref:ATP-dependent DNA ligase n=1 Tax=Streptomyces hydrogenans TaxID=1873719 RepID=UPI0037F8DA72
MLAAPVEVLRPRSADGIPAQAPPPRELRYSLKPDGFRALAFVLEGGRVVLRSRSRRGLSPEFSDIAAAPTRLLPPGIVLDGELCAYSGGLLCFTDLLRPRADRAQAGVPVSSIVFDLLAVPGRDVRALPPRDRWELLGTGLGEAGPPLQRVPATEDEETARVVPGPAGRGRGGDRGQVARLSAYRSGRTWFWRKVRHSDTGDAELVGLVGPAARPGRCWSGRRTEAP